MGVITIKVPARGRMLREDGINMEQALNYVYSFNRSLSKLIFLIFFKKFILPIHFYS